MDEITRGGQGRSASDLEQDAGAFGWSLFAMGILIGAVLGASLVELLS